MEMLHQVVQEQERSVETLVFATTSGTLAAVDGVPTADFNTLMGTTLVSTNPEIEETGMTGGITAAATGVTGKVEFASSSKTVANVTLVKTVNTPTTFLRFKFATPSLKAESADMVIGADFYTSVQQSTKVIEKCLRVAPLL